MPHTRRLPSRSSTRSRRHRSMLSACVFQYRAEELYASYAENAQFTSSGQSSSTRGGRPGKSASARLAARMAQPSRKKSGDGGQSTLMPTPATRTPPRSSSNIPPTFRASPVGETRTRSLGHLMRTGQPASDKPPASNAATAGAAAVVANGGVSGRRRAA